MPIKASNQITISNVLDGQNAIAVILSNENHTFSANSSGQATATTISTSISAYAGTTKIATTVGSITGLPTGMSMTVNNNGKTDTTISITVTTSLTAMSGSVNIPITANGTTITKTFSYTLSKTGATGSAGQNATAYWLVTSTAAISKSVTGVYNPSSIILTGKYKTGNSAVANYSGRFQMFFNGSTTATYTSSANEVTKSYTIPANTTSIRCVMYASGGTSTILDEQTIPVVSDGQTGTNGRGVSSIVEYYLASSSSSGVTTSTAGWATTIPTITATNKYLWNYEVIQYTDNTSSEPTTPKIIGAYGNTGNAGKGIKSTAITYQASSSGTTTPTGTWATAIPSVSANQFLWTRTVITYTDNTTSTSYSIGKMGATGNTGKGIASTAITYQASTSGTTVPTGTWSTSIPSVTANQFLWTRTVITYTDNTTSTSYAIGKMGATGATGATGNGISGITNYYLATASASGVTTSTSGWTTTVQTLTATNKYLWNYEVVTYTNGNSYTSTPVIIGAYGDKGQTGATGATGTGYTIVLTNENHTFPASATAAIAGSVSTNIVLYKNTTQIASTISKIGTTNVSGNQTGVATGVTGLTANVTNNGTTTATITFNATTALTTRSGTVAVTITADGKTFVKNFSFSLAMTGATGGTGAAAKSVDITATSQVFKSTDGGLTFSPDNIKLTPVFQGGIAFSKWQYSTNGGTSWTDVASGSNGLTIASGVLTIAKTCTLFTDSITALSFKCISNNASYYDVMTVLKLYDVTDIEIGGRNLIKASSFLYTKLPTNANFEITTVNNVSSSEFTSNGYHYTATANNGAQNSSKGILINSKNFELHIGDTISVSNDIKGKFGTSNTGLRIMHASTTDSNFWASGTPATPHPTTIAEWTRKSLVYTIPTNIKIETDGSFKLYIFWGGGTGSDVDVYVKNVKLERGNKPTDWTPAPEDVQEQIETVKTTVSGISTKVDAVENKITDKIWKSDITESVNTYDQTTTQIIRDQVSSNLQTLGSIQETVSDVQTTISIKADDSRVTEVESKVVGSIQDLNGFKQTVSNTYTTKDETEAAITEMEQTAEGWKYIAAVTGQYDPTDPNSVKPAPTSKLQKVITIDLRGITVEDEETDVGAKTILNSDGLVGYVKRGSNTGDERVFQISKNQVYTNRLYVDNGMDLTTIKGVPREYSGGQRSFEFIKSGGTS